MESELRLTYFNSRGRAEVARMLMKLAGKEFTDRRVEKEEWEVLKPTTPKGQLPILEVDGTMICESGSIARYLAREFKLYGASNMEAASVDQVLDTIEGVIQAIIQLLFLAKTDEAKAEAAQKAESSMASLETLTKALKKGSFLLGDKPSVADAAIQNMMENSPVIPDIKVDAYPTLKGIAKSFEELPAIAEWLKARPVTER